MDPNERKALENQNQNFMDILERICPSPEDAAEKGSSEKTDEASYEASEDLFLGAYCVPLTWEDQYAATNVAINYAPQGHEFVYKPPRPVRGVATPRKDFHVLQEGYAHTSAYPDTEVHLQPDFIVSAKSAIARGPYHRHTRAKLRTLAYIKCKNFEEHHKKKEPVNILAPAPVDIAYEEMFASLPEHKYGPRGLLEISSKGCLLQDKMKQRPFPRWLRRRASPTSDSPPCSPSRFDVNRRAQLVNPHMKLAKLGLVRCKSPPPPRAPRRAYAVGSNANNIATATWLRQPSDRIRLPPISQKLPSRSSGSSY
ncbi:unnamed protein product [Schistocephalus solidus]|uniref:Uncharacterized protein n=1 Tax=Schistocephalus solidus TaxID=70667 RepID=A0A3P7BFG2_SCHSO|nr:unnamed protein product [Schistocephalus solidus]